MNLLRPLLVLVVAALPAAGVPAPNGVQSNYCVATPNSTGFPAEIFATGTLSVTTNDSNLFAKSCPPFENGVFMYSHAPTRIPFGNGFLCVSPLGPGIFSLEPVLQTSGVGVASRYLDLTDLPSGGQISGGATWYFQFWFRDPNAAGAYTNLSEGLSVTFCP